MDHVKEANFTNNFADRHGGVMWADADSTAVTYDQFILHQTDFIDESRQCFVVVGNEPPNTNVRYLFGLLVFCVSAHISFINAQGHAYFLHAHTNSTTGYALQRNIY
jgi:hypothetical protein